MDLERERGITIKFKRRWINIWCKRRIEYIFHLIDTQVTWISLMKYHEVYSLWRAILVVDAACWIEAQNISECI